MIYAQEAYTKNNHKQNAIFDVTYTASSSTSSTDKTQIKLLTIINKSQHIYHFIFTQTRSKPKENALFHFSQNYHRFAICSHKQFTVSVRLFSASFYTMSSTPLGIPKAEFIEDMAAYAATVEKAKELFQEKQELLTKYRILEQHLIEKRQQLKGNRPDVAGNLDAVRKIASANYQNEPVTHFQIADGLYGTAKLKNDQKVSLWLGANLLVEYPLEEAEELLSNNLDKLDNQIKEVESNLVFLRDQIITTEVTVSRLTNHIIALQKSKK